MKTVAVTIAIDERFVPVIDALREVNDVGCANSFLSLLLTSALIEAQMTAEKEAEYEDQKMRSVEPEFDTDDTDSGGTLH